MATVKDTSGNGLFIDKSNVSTDPTSVTSVQLDVISALLAGTLKVDEISSASVLRALSNNYEAIKDQEFFLDSIAK